VEKLEQIRANPLRWILRLLPLGTTAGVAQTEVFGLSKLTRH
jgi:hypothetical protein